MTTKRRLAGYVTLDNPDTNETVSFGPDDEVPAWAQKAITNPSAWEEYDDKDDGETDILRTDSTRTEMIRAAERAGLTVGKDFAASASKDTIAAAIKRKLFEDDNPEAELTGDTPQALADDTNGQQAEKTSSRRGSKADGE